MGVLVLVLLQVWRADTADPVRITGMQLLLLLRKLLPVVDGMLRVPVLLLPVCRTDRRTWPRSQLMLHQLWPTPALPDHPFATPVITGAQCVLKQHGPCAPAPPVPACGRGARGVEPSLADMCHVPTAVLWPSPAAPHSCNTRRRPESRPTAAAAAASCSAAAAAAAHTVSTRAPTLFCKQRLCCYCCCRCLLVVCEGTDWLEAPGGVDEAVGPRSLKELADIGRGQCKGAVLHQLLRVGL